MEPWIHVPEKSGMDAVLPVPLLATEKVGGNACPKTGVAAAVASDKTKSKSRRFCVMLASLFGSPPLALSHQSYTLYMFAWKPA
jgi:hypothetical protein